MFLNHPNVRKIQEKPVVLQWFDSVCDVCDAKDTANSIAQIKTELNYAETQGKESHFIMTLLS
jgi:hypothetical protein